MTLTTNIVFNAYALVIVIILLFQLKRQHDHKAAQFRLFFSMGVVLIALLTADVFSRLDGTAQSWYPLANRISNWFVFLTNPVMPSLWLLFIHDQITGNPLTLRKNLFKLSSLHLIYILIIIIGQQSDAFFSIDADNIYHRGPMYWVPLVWTVTLILSSELIILLLRRKIESKHHIAMMLFPVFPMIGIALQVGIYGLSMMLPATVISLLVMYMNMQNRHMSIDYLTGVNNRRKLDEVLQERIKSCQDGSNCFGAIMIDLNDFKMINDSLGHDTGDDALETTAKLLRSCVRADDMIARYGGDEFVIIIKTRDIDKLRNTAGRIQSRIRHFNNHSNKPYRLSFGMGIALYDRSLHKTPDDLMRQLDVLMYEHKRRIKSTRKEA